MGIQIQLQLQAEAGMTSKPADRATAAPLMGDEEANIPNDDGARQGTGSLSWLPTFLGYSFFLTLNSATAIVRSRWDATAVAFVALSYAHLVLLFYCLRMYERADAGSAKRTWLKLGVWLLTTTLTLVFSYKVAAIMPPPVAVVVWLIFSATIAGGFYAFFIYEEK